MYILYCVQGFGLFFPFKLTFLKQHVLNTLKFSASACTSVCACSKKSQQYLQQTQVISDSGLEI